MYCNYDLNKNLKGKNKNYNANNCLIILMFYYVGDNGNCNGDYLFLLILFFIKRFF